MGRDIDLFVHPERISSQLICPICTQVLDNPVQTSSEHLFCEEELLEWLTRSNLCPVTKTELDPTSIRKPGRIVMNMLSELELRCPNTVHGCSWIGQNGQLSHHLKSCEYRGPEEMRSELAKKDAQIQQLMDKIESLENNNEELLEENMELKAQLIECEKKLRIYNAFLESGASNNKVSSPHGYGGGEHKAEFDEGKTPEGSGAGKSTTRYVGSDVSKLSRLRTLNTLPEKSTPDNPSKAAEGEGRPTHK